MPQGDLYQFGDFRLDVRNARLTRGADAVALPPKTFDLLVTLVRHAGELVDKDSLMREVWPDTFVEEANLSRHIWTLRKALGDEGYVETIPKRGYRFAAAVRTLPAEGGPARDETIGRRRIHWSAWLAAGVAVAAIAWSAKVLPRRAPDSDRLTAAVSPDAVKWFDLGDAARAQGRFRDALPLYQHAVELDPGFALAESRLAEIYGTLREPGEQQVHALRAYELRGRATERARLDIDAAYYGVVGDVPRQADALQLLIQARPNEPSPHLELARLYRQTGRYEAALEEARLAVRLDSGSAQARATLGRALVDLNRFDEARPILQGDPESPSEPLHALLFELAFMRGDAAAMQRELAWAARTANEYSAAIWQARAHDFRGQRRQAREWYARSLVVLRTRGGQDRMAEDAAINVSRDAIVGDCAAVPAAVDRALTVRNFNTLTLTSLARALCRDLTGADALAAELAQAPRLDWLNRTVSVPIIRAFILASRTPTPDAVAMARTIEPYELGQTLWPIYLRGLVHGKAGQDADAAAAFRRILSQRGPAGMSIRYPLAQVQLARALTRGGDAAGAAEAYAQFLTLWDDADPDLPILIAARKEYAAVRNAPLTPRSR
jgi:DNA-binding winged helix-turn-helix (wHTH) protein/predicted Zn-dependent protease